MGQLIEAEKLYGLVTLTLMSLPTTQLRALAELTAVSLQQISRLLPCRNRSSTRVCLLQITRNPAKVARSCRF
jgi:hypothetical protein